MIYIYLYNLFKLGLCLSPHQGGLDEPALASPEDMNHEPS